MPSTTTLDLPKSSSTSFYPDLTRVYPEPSDLLRRLDHFDRLPDSLLLLVFNKIADVKALGRCCVVSRRFHSLVPQVDTVLVRVDCVISDDDSTSSSEKSRAPFSSLFRLVFGGIVKPLQALGQFLGPRRSLADEIEQAGVTHHSPTQVLKNFNEIRFLCYSTRISTIPTWIGDLISLIEVDLSSNFLSDLPETISNLHNLKSLSLSNNGLKSLPSSLFKMCLMLTSLDLHNTEITMDILRQIEGWENFDERRRLKQQKKLDFRVVGSTAFDEGADKS